MTFPDPTVSEFYVDDRGQSYRWGGRSWLRACTYGVNNVPDDYVLPESPSAAGTDPSDPNNTSIYYWDQETGDTFVWSDIEGRFVRGGPEFVFPDPSVSTSYTAPTGDEYSWDGQKWVRVCAVPPPPPTSGPWYPCPADEAVDPDGAFGHFFKIKYGGDRFIALGGWGNLVSKWCRVSYDGINWEWPSMTGAKPKNADGTFAQVKDITYGNGRWVAVGGQSGSQKWSIWSDDGIHWEHCTLAPTADGNIGEKEMRVVDFSNGYFLAATGQAGNCFSGGGTRRFAYSNNGQNWWVVTTDASVNPNTTKAGNGMIGHVGSQLFSMTTGYPGSGIGNGGHWFDPGPKKMYPAQGNAFQSRNMLVNWAEDGSVSIIPSVADNDYATTDGKIFTPWYNTAYALESTWTGSPAESKGGGVGFGDGIWVAAAGTSKGQGMAYSVGGGVTGTWVFDDSGSYLNWQGVHGDGWGAIAVGGGMAVATVGTDVDGNVGSAVPSARKQIGLKYAKVSDLQAYITNNPGNLLT